jgi:hypothetical protein
VTAEGIPPGSLAPGTSVDLIARTSTAGCSYAIGYALPPGHYEFVASVGIDGSKVPKPALGKPTPVPESAEWWVVGPVTVR